MANHPEDDQAGDSTIDAVTMELDAMRAIAAALGSLRDREARLRVLRWANERFDSPVRAASALPAACQPLTLGFADTSTLDDGALAVGTFADAELTPLDETALAVEALYEFFDSPAPAAAAAIPIEIPAALAPAASVAAEPAAASGVAAESPAAAPASASVEPAEAAATPATTSKTDESLDTLVRGFASELKRLAVECQTG